MNGIMKYFLMLLMMVCAVNSSAHTARSKDISKKDLLKIVRSENELRFDGDLAGLLKSASVETRIRAALAAGRIGDEKALPFLSNMLSKGASAEAQMAAFAIGEIESIKGAGIILDILKNTERPGAVRARAVEAAGKIAAADSKSGESRLLGEAILDNLELEYKRGKEQDRGVILLAITASIRAKPDDADLVIAKFLTNLDPRIRADAANALARLGSKGYGRKLESVLLTDGDPVARANAARALGAAEDKEAVNLLVQAALTDEDQRVRVGAYGALGRINEKGTANQILEQAEKIFLKLRESKYANPPETNELLTISVALGSIMRGTGDERTVGFLDKLSKAQMQRAPEVEFALLRVSPKFYAEQRTIPAGDWKATRAIAQAFGSALSQPGDANFAKKLELKAIAELRSHLLAVFSGEREPDLAFPDVLSAYSKHKQADLADVLRRALKLDDVIIRATAADLIADLDPEKGNASAIYMALREAYVKSESDSINDATLAVLEGVKKQHLKLKGNKEISIDVLEPVKLGLLSPDYLVRRKALEVAKAVDLEDESSGHIVKFDEKGVSRVRPADYSRAVSRKKASAVLTTAKGSFTIEFFPAEAPLTVENFINLAKSGYFNGLEIHRVVPNFVVQDGDPRGDGSGGPGWQIRCEINQMAYERGTVGMALSGKDTGGSQWFVAHSPQPHLDGGYTVFGKVNETGMRVVDSLTRGDVIEKVVIVE